MKTLDSWVEGVALMSETKLEEIASLLRELLRWSKFGGKRELKAALEETLGRDAEKLVYEYTDGQHSTRDIEEITGVSKSSVAKYWEKWFKLGIVEKASRFEGRMQHICSLEEVGLEVPPLPAKPPKEQSATTAETGAGGEVSANE